MADGGVFTYVLLVSFLTGPAASLRGERAAVLCASPYDGVAAWYAGPYDHDPVDPDRRTEEFAEASRATGKQVWPWVFLNRTIGYVPAPGKGDGLAAQKTWFARIPGLDLGGESGDLAAFLELWRGALRTARRTGAPGVLADFEAYNNYRAYRLDYLAGLRGVPVEQVRGELRDLGAQLADIAIEEHPEAVIWLTFTGLTDRKWAGILQGYDLRSVSHVVLGLLERARARRAALTVVSGGMITHGYCTGDLASYRTKIAARRQGFAAARERYPNLDLGGTIAPWNDRLARTGWLRSACVRAPQRVAFDFEPYFRALLDGYSWVWVYAAGVSDYTPYAAAPAAPIDDALGAALAGTRDRR